MEIVTVGLDPALRRGSLVGTIWTLYEGKLVLKRWKKLYSWDHPKATDLKLEVLKQQAFNISYEIEKYLLDLGYPLGKFEYVPWLAVDWDIYLASFGGRRFIASMLAYMIGQIDAHLGFRGLGLSYITPKQVRDHYGLHPRTKKRDVWKRVGYLPRTDGDTKDAIILASINAERHVRRYGLEHGHNK